jgi:DHA3 family tetracycline resistance protein-like MFS transporter
MKRPSATTVFYALEFLLSMPAWVVISIYLVRDLQLSPLQLVLMGTAMEASVFLFEVPTGVVADTYGRRLSQIIGYIGMGLAWLLVGVFSAPWLIIALWAAWGVSYTFTSGAYEAWITDEVGVERVPKVFLRGARFSYAGALAGVVLLVAIGTESLRAAVIGGGAVTMACGIACIFLMPETGFRRRPVAERLRPLGELRRTGGAAGRFVRAQPVLLIVIGIALFVGLSSEAFDRLKEAHFIRDIGLPSVGGLDAVVWFGGFTVVAMVFGFFAVGALQRRFERSGTGRIAALLFTFTAVLLVAELAYALAGGAGLAIVAILTALLARQLLWPLWMTWVNQQVTDSSVRATVISMTGQADAVGQAAAGPVLGAVGNAFGIPAALAAGALLLSPALLLYGRALRHGGREPELEELPATT